MRKEYRMTKTTRPHPIGILVSITGLLLLTTQAQAGIFVSGDNTPAYYAAYGDNSVFFNNVLQSGTSVLAHEMYGTALGNNLSNYYDSLAGVNSSYIDRADVTADLLTNVDLFVTGSFGGGFTDSEIGAIDSFLDTGGSVMFMGDYTQTVDNINNALTALGSNMQLYGDPMDCGIHYATGDNIAVGPFTAGVSSFKYGFTYGVSGGTALFFDSTNRAFMAHESSSASTVPAPAALSLMGTGLLSLLGYRRRVRPTV